MKVGVNMEYRLSNVVDIPEFKDLMESFYSITGISCLIKYINGDVFNVPFKSHLYPGSVCDGHEEDILKQIDRGNKIGIYKHYNGLIYIGIPIIINKKHIATTFLNPVFFEESYRKNAIEESDEFGPGNREYINSIMRVPVISEKNMKKIINFFRNEFMVLAKLEYRLIEDSDRTKVTSENYTELYSTYEQLYASYKKFRLRYDEMAKMAYYDQLTNLYNWNYFMKEVENQIKKYPRSSFSIFQIELNNFKSINDIFGYEYGDKLLKKIGNTLKKLNIGIVSRMGGDGFLLLKREMNDKIELNDLAKYIVDTISGLWNFDGNEALVSANIGITVFPRDGNKVAKLIRNADIALNKAKLSGQNSYRLFEKSMYDEILKKTELERELRKAIKNNEFILYYQPQVDIKTKKVVGFEALIRWNSPILGWVMPLEFINLAEETGIIVSIGEWVLKTACIQNKKWKDKGYSYDFISINVSPIQLKDSNFLSTVRKVLEETDLKPEYLEVEITESVMMESLELNLGVITELKNMGVRVALDDFGSGYSSLNYLKSIPINTLKIDKTFIDGICKHSYEDIITGEIIKLAHKMKLEVVAEGVEMEEQIKYLEGENCNKIQGYYFGKPMPPEDINMFLEKKDLQL